MRQTLLTFAAGLLLGGAAFTALGFGDGEANAAEPEFIERTHVVSGSYRGPSLAAIRETVRTEMASASNTGGTLGAPGGAQEPESAPEVEEPLDPEREATANAAYADATELVDTALTRGVWDDEDASALRPSLASMTGAQVDEVLDGLIIAINTQQISVTTVGPPF